MERELIGPYRILGVIGKGGMGTVYEGVHEEIERRVAIKILHAEFVANSEYAERFLNEAKAVNRIGHPGIVQIHEMGRLPDGAAYLVMELLIGETVGQRLKQRGGCLPLDEAIAIVKDVGNALAAAHAKSIIHRDLKPDNIMVVPDPAAARGERSKLLDFGIAKMAVAASGASGRTQVGTVMGTLWYMSPEQLRDTAKVNDRTDVYALGVVLYQLLSGRVPFLADSEVELIAAHLRDVPQSLEQILPELPKPLTALVGRMLEKDPEIRPPMRQVVEELSGLAASMSSGQLPAVLPPPAVASSPGRRVIPPTVANPSRQPQSSRSPAIEPLGELAPELTPSHPATLTGSASQRAHPSRGRRFWLRLATVPALGLLGICAVLVAAALKKHRPHEQPAASAKPTSNQLPPMPPPPDEPIPPEDPQPPVVKPEASSGAKNGPTGCQLERPTEKCIRGSLPPGMDRLIAASLRSAGIKLCPNEELRLNRYGNHYLFEGALRRAPAEKQSVFGTSLQGRISGATLPAAFTIKCSSEKKQGK